MHLSMSTSALSTYISKGLSDYEVIKTIKECGFNYVDYDLTGPNYVNPEETGRELKKSLSELNVVASQAHATGFDYSNEANRDKTDDCRRWFVFCKEAGIPAIVVHPSPSPNNNREEFFELNVEFYKKMIPFIEETGVGMLLENIGNPSDPYFLLDGKDLRQMVDEVNHPLVTACWDIGHANHFFASLHPQYDSIMALGDKLTAIHLHDNAGNFTDDLNHIRVDMHMIPYMSWAGSTNFDAVLNGLIDVNYKGTFNLELSAGNKRHFVEPFYKNGVLEDRLMTMPLELWKTVYKTAYEIGKYMLESYGVYED